MKKIKIGMRTIKTTIAVITTIYISQLLNLQNPLLAGIAALVTMQSDIINSLEEGKSRLLGTVFGAIVGLIFVVISPGNLILAGIGMILVIIVCNLMNWENSITIALIVFLGVMIEQDLGERVDYSINRTIDTLVGVVIATLINIFISPPDLEKRIISIFKTLLNECDKLVEDILHENIVPELSKLEKIKLKYEVIEQNYDTLKNEASLNLYRKEIKCKNIKTTMNLFESLYNDLYIISEMKHKPEPGIYNYHLTRAAETLKELRKNVDIMDNTLSTSKKQNRDTE